MYSINEHIEREGAVVVAEIGNNHDGSLSRACELIDIAADSGADLVKFQTFRGRDIVTPTVLSSDYTGWDVDDFTFWHEFLDTIALSYEDQEKAFKHAERRGITVFSTPTSPDSVTFLESIGCPLYKVASMDITNVRLLRAIEATKKPVVVSTGMAREEEVKNAIEIFSDVELVLLHCISDYPLNPRDANMCSIRRLKELGGLGRYVGFSDHSLGNELSLVAIGADARVIEKHITYDRKSKKKAEHHFSLNPEELAELVRLVKTYRFAIGEQPLLRSQGEEKNRNAYRRSIHINKELKRGYTLTEDDLEILRPGNGAKPDSFDMFIGSSLVQDMKAWEPLLPKDIASHDET